MVERAGIETNTDGRRLFPEDAKYSRRGGYRLAAELPMFITFP
jgi:hypothetical protein